MRYYNSKLIKIPLEGTKFVIHGGSSYHECDRFDEQIRIQWSPEEIVFKITKEEINHPSKATNLKQLIDRI
jgi:hypothetical protein